MSVDLLNKRELPIQIRCDITCSKLVTRMTIMVFGLIRREFLNL